MLPDAFGCSVANRFGNLLDDDADPFDLLSKAETEKEKRRRQKKEEEEKKCKQKKTGQKETQKDRRVPVSLEDPVPVRKQLAHGILAESNSREEVQRGMRRATVGQYRTNQDQEEYPKESAFSKTWFNASYDTRSRGGTRAGRGQRGGGAGYTRNSENFNLRGKREYDRHSGIGVSPEEKRGGRGPWNWGSVEDTAGDLMEVTEVTSNAPYKTEESQAPVEDAQNQSPEETDGEMLVHVAMEMTLDEWKALQESSRPKAEFNLRKAESKIPSKARVIHQSKCKESLKGNLEELDEDDGFLRRSVNDITSLLDINFGSLGRPSRGGRGRGARSGLTGRLESVQPKVEMQEEGLAPNPDDPEDFPALTG